MPSRRDDQSAVIEDSRHAAFIADECRLWITVHYYPGETYAEITSEIEEHLLDVAKADPWHKTNQPTFKWAVVDDRGPWRNLPSLEVDPEHPGTALLQEAHARIVGTKPVIDVSPSVTDGGWFGDAGIPAMIYGPGKAPGCAFGQ